MHRNSQSDSANISLDAADEATARLAGGRVKSEVRANRVRLSCHLYNDDEDVDRTLEVLTDLIHAGGGDPRHALRQLATVALTDSRAMDNVGAIGGPPLALGSRWLPSGD